jgi:lysyl-tRNA synthetase class 2
LGSTKIKIGDVEVDLEQPWPRLTFRELILKDTGIDIEKHQEAPSLLKAIKEKRINLEEEDPEKLGRGNLIDLLYKRVSRPKIVQPSFLVEHPISLSPLARANDTNPELTDRFQLVVNGVELINAYSELVDPVEQMKRLEEQAAAHAALEKKGW